MIDRFTQTQRILALSTAVSLGALGCVNNGAESPSVPTFEVSNDATTVELGNFNSADVQVDTATVDRQLVISVAGYTGVMDSFAACSTDEVALTGELADTAAVEVGLDGGEYMTVPFTAHGDCTVDSPEKTRECEVSMEFSAAADLNGQSPVVLDQLSVVGSIDSFHDCEE